MIIRVAMQHNESGLFLVGAEGDRHDALYTSFPVEGGAWTQGFLTDNGRFLDRKQAAAHAYECGQVPELADSVISEELW